MSVSEQTERRVIKRVPEPSPVAPANAPIIAPSAAAVPLAPAKPNAAARWAWRFIKLMIFLAILTGVGYIGGNVWMDSHQYESTDDAFVDGHIVPISPEISARIKSVHVIDNQLVKQGDLLVELDPTDFQIVLDQKRAAEAAARSRLAQSKTQLEVVKAQVGQAQAALHVEQTNADNMQSSLSRMTTLDPRARSQQQMDDATAAQRSSASKVDEAQAMVAAAQAKVADAQASVSTAESDANKAAVDSRQAEIQLGYCTITAPSDGRITKKAVELGMYVSIGQPLLSIVPTDVWVTANFKETQLDAIRVGQPVTIDIDAYPEHPYQGTVQSIQSGTGSKFALLPSENATGNFVKVVQRVPVKIVLDPGQTDDAQHLLAPGMSAIPKIKVRPRETWSSLFHSYLK